LQERNSRLIWLVTDVWRRTVARKFSIRGLCVSAGGLGLCGGARHSKNWQKLNWFILFHVSIWVAWSFFWGANLTYGDGTDLTFYNSACRHLGLFTMVRFSLKIKTSSLYVIWKKQDQIWENIFCIPKNMYSRTPVMAIAVLISFFLGGVVSLIWKRFFTWKSECKSFWSFLVLVEILGHQWSDWLVQELPQLTVFRWRFFERWSVWFNKTLPRETPNRKSKVCIVALTPVILALISSSSFELKASSQAPSNTLQLSKTLCGDAAQTAFALGKGYESQVYQEQWCV